MNIWDRVWFTVLILADRLLGTCLVERELAHMQRRVDAYQAQASAIQQRMAGLERLLHVIHVELCILYLRQRRLLQPETWLRFAPAEGIGEERDLDLLISQLVKHGLATVRTEAVSERTYVYHLRPDWDAIADLLSTWKEHLDPLTIAWVEEVRSGQSGRIRH